MKLNRDEVRKLHAAGWSAATVALEYGTTIEAVRYHLLPDEARAVRVQQANARARAKSAKAKNETKVLTEENNRINQEIEKLAESSDMTYAEIAQHLGVSQKRVKYWANKRERTRRIEEAQRRAARLKAERDEVIKSAVERKVEQTAEQALNRETNTLLHRLRAQAERRGISFTLEKADVRRFVEAEQCDRTGLPLLPKGDGGDWNWSVDRIDSTGGYDRDNVQVVCWIYNRAKGASTDAAVLHMAVALVGKQIQDQGLTFEQLRDQTLGFQWD